MRMYSDYSDETLTYYISEIPTTAPMHPVAY